jgi:hypothetical protein
MLIQHRSEVGMFVRIATFEGGDVDRIAQLVDERRQSGEIALPAGVRRIMVLNGERRLFLAFFETRDELEAAEQEFDAMGDDIPEDIRGRRVSVDVYEVASDEALAGGDASRYGAI